MPSSSQKTEATRATIVTLSRRSRLQTICHGERPVMATAPSTAADSAASMTAPVSS
jgi:hypothetical protein